VRLGERAVPALKRHCCGARESAGVAPNRTPTTAEASTVSGGSLTIALGQRNNAQGA